MGPVNVFSFIQLSNFREEAAGFRRKGGRKYQAGHPIAWPDKKIKNH